MSRTRPSLRSARCAALRPVPGARRGWRAFRWRDLAAAGMGQFCPLSSLPRHLARARPALKHMRAFTLGDFDFALPPELIAQHPAAERSASRLLDGTGDRAGRPHLPRPALAAARRRPAGVQRHARDQGAPVRREADRRQARAAGRARAAGPRGRGAHEGQQEAAGRAPRCAMAGGFTRDVLGRWPDEHGAAVPLRASSDAAKTRTR